MREIKFRAVVFKLQNPHNCFEKRKKEIWEFSEVKDNPDGYAQGSDCDDDYLDLNDWLKNPMHDTHHRYILQQFTGLKDKNSKEIYEGDIINTGGELNGTVVYELCEFLTRFSKTLCRRLNVNIQNEIEVIGNIYENPELIE